MCRTFLKLIRYLQGRFMVFVSFIEDIVALVGYSLLLQK